MTVTWGDRLNNETQGLDILGVRGLDQSMEALLVNGITTISPRGRYFTTLTWGLGEFFDGERGAGATQFDLHRLKRFLFRAEYLTLACTVLDATPGDAGAALGSDIFSAEMAALRAGQPLVMPAERTGAMLNTYFGPCRALGLLGQGEGEEPYRLTPRGRAVWEARNSAMEADGTRRLLEATSLDCDEVRAAVPHLSLKRLGKSGAEAEIFQEALTVPWQPMGSRAEDVAANYTRFAETLTWLREWPERPIRPEAILSDAWRRAAVGYHFESDVHLGWAEYEGRRRLHFALELIFSAVSDAVLELRETTLDEVVSAWMGEPELPEELAHAWPDAGRVMDWDGVTTVASVPSDLWLLLGPPAGLSNTNPHARALAGFALVAAVSRQSATFRQSGRIRDRRETGEQALAIVDAAGRERFADTLRALAAVAVNAHLRTTFRKMAAGLGCSLRFFPEGRTLRTTGMETTAGRSGPRLGSVIRLLQDAGIEGLGAGG